MAIQTSLRAPHREQARVPPTDGCLADRGGRDGSDTRVLGDQIDDVAQIRIGVRLVAAAPVADTVKEASDGTVVRTLDRTRLWAVQTPQVFRRAALEDALAQPEHVLAAATDDAGLVEARRGVVRVVESSARNLKVTTPTDLKLAELLLADRLPPPSAP